nr:MAG TPA: hypothetical protein [Caudoviricetes sp.]
MPHLTPTKSQNHYRQCTCLILGKLLQENQQKTHYI